MTEIPELAEAGTLDGTELMEVSQASSTVTITATTISALASDQSYNDSGSGFVAAGFAVGDRVRVQDFSGSAVNNLIWGIVTDVTAGKLTIGGTEGAVIVDESAGDSVTIYKWTSKHAVTQAAGDLGGGGETGEYRAGITTTVSNVTGDNTYYQIIWNDEVITADWASMNTSTGALTLDAGTYVVMVALLFNDCPTSTGLNVVFLKDATIAVSPIGYVVGGLGRATHTAPLSSDSSFVLTIEASVFGASLQADLTAGARTFLQIAKVA